MVAGAKAIFRQYTGSALVLCGHAASFSMSLRGAKRRDNPHLLRQHKAKRHYSRRIRRSCGFALSIANLQSFPAGMRIATPVCALVRNDMQKTGTYSRVQGRPPLCHCYENKVGTFRKRAQKIDPEPGRVFSAGLCLRP